MLAATDNPGPGRRLAFMYPMVDVSASRKLSLFWAPTGEGKDIPLTAVATSEMTNVRTRMRPSFLRRCRPPGGSQSSLTGTNLYTVPPFITNTTLARGVDIVERIAVERNDVRGQTRCDGAYLVFQTE